jgi:hypothetical protein
MAEPIVHELHLPSDVLTSGGQEVLRAFVVEGELHVSLSNAFERPSTWGTLLVDVARHVARMYSQEGDGLRDQALDEIYRTLQSEWSLPDDHSDMIN